MNVPPPTRSNGLATPATAFVATYVPRQCGIASFTHDLLEGLRQGGAGALRVVAVDRGEGLSYPAEVTDVLPMGDRRAYRRVGRRLAEDGTQAISLQHEYGIFGGHSGSHVLDLLDAAGLPVVTTLHTILARPTPTQESVLRAVAERSARLVTMNDRGREILAQRYGIDPARIAVIPHGVPAFEHVDRGQAKAALGLAGTKVILSFGLLGPHKNVEQVLEALARIAGSIPDVRYAVVGATHPEIVRRHGEAYRERLTAHAAELGIADLVRWEQRYLEDRDVATWLAAADVFVTPYRNEQQIASGTLAYALAAGAAVVSTPYEHARELLADERGVLVPFNDVAALATALRDLLADDAHRLAISRRASEHGRAMAWPAVARQHGALLAEVAASGPAEAAAPAHAAATVAIPPIAALTRGTPGDGALRSPAGLPSAGRWGTPAGPAGAHLPVVRRHLDEMRDAVGVFQFAVGRQPDPSHGYCTDDVARALVVDVRHAALEPGPAIATAIRRDLAFLAEAFNPARGRFRNFRTTEGRWPEDVGSEDSHGRAVQALGEAVARCPDRPLAAEARRLLAAALPAAAHLEWERPQAYAILGCAAALDDGALGARSRTLLRDLVDGLAAKVAGARAADAAWPWPEDECTYDTGVIPEALVVGGVALGRRDAVRLGLDVLGWLLSAQTAPAGHLRPIGNRGWWPRGGRPAAFDQQPIEPASLVSAAVAARLVTGDARWAAAADRAFAWFLGANDLGIPLADPARGACRDGLEPDGPNVNEGAESTLAWLLAVERMRDLRRAEAAAYRPVGPGQERTYATTSERRAVASAIDESAAP